MQLESASWRMLLLAISLSNCCPAHARWTSGLLSCLLHDTIPAHHSSTQGVRTALAPIKCSSTLFTWLAHVALVVRRIGGIPAGAASFRSALQKGSVGLIPGQHNYTATHFPVDCTRQCALHAAHSPTSAAEQSDAAVALSSHDQTHLQLAPAAAL